LLAQGIYDASRDYHQGETQELMTLFYAKWLSGEDKQQALQDAQQELGSTVKTRYGDDKPFYWAASSWWDADHQELFAGF